ncbi:MULTISPECIES: DUF2802 domain-containing protein [Nitrincola]|uniref:DUF2802 domain-containing protein n=1 Tax=Nitrincola nitratireducens TaxID=1229521 RepID=W9VED6_9GAMM|nr:MULTISPECIES: DUF2802 domain-containing protein [Nitrincola]EXJ09075.1 hypothetical protein D791_04005 [Nitrincola nitratireducens]
MSQFAGGAYGWVILASLAFLAIVAVGLSIMALIRVKRQEQRHQVLLKVLRNEIQGATGSSIGLGKRLVAVERKLNITAEKQIELENRDPGVLAYNQAARLMEMGAGVEDLVRSCGIGRPEAELMALLHRELQDDKSISHKH